MEVMMLAANRLGALNLIFVCVMVIYFDYQIRGLKRRILELEKEKS